VKKILYEDIESTTAVQGEQKVTRKKKSKRMPYKKMYYSLLGKFLKQQKPKKPNGAMTLQYHGGEKSEKREREICCDS